jgi:hypothetical protein
MVKAPDHLERMQERLIATHPRQRRQTVSTKIPFTGYIDWGRFMGIISTPYDKR